jgi:hypothetical protein
MSGGARTEPLDYRDNCVGVPPQSDDSAEHLTSLGSLAMGAERSINRRAACGPVQNGAQPSSVLFRPGTPRYRNCFDFADARA